VLNLKLNIEVKKVKMKEELNVNGLLISLKIFLNLIVLNKHHPDSIKLTLLVNQNLT